MKQDRLLWTKRKVFKELFHHFNLCGPESCPSTAGPLPSAFLSPGRPREDVGMICPLSVDSLVHRSQSPPGAAAARPWSPGGESLCGGGGRGAGPRTSHLIACLSPRRGGHTPLSAEDSGLSQPASSVLVFGIGCHKDKFLPSKIVLF